MSAQTITYQHWRVERDTDGVAWATIDCDGQPSRPSTNTLSQPVMEELVQILDDCDRSPPKGLIFRSGKPAGFIAGADINEFSRLDTPQKGVDLVARGWRLFDRLAQTAYPTLALVRGHCLGGGLELALACRYLLVVDEPATRLALPEVLLGILPGWGGILRLPERVGPQTALEMMLTGKSLNADQAQRHGLADERVPPRVMDEAAAQWVLSGQSPRRPAIGQRLLGGPFKSLLAALVRRKLAERARPAHYPAPYAIIELWQRHRGNPLDAPELIESLVGSPTTRNLLRVYALQERLKSSARDSDFQARHVHVIGAGVMGGDIAAWCAQRGLTVTLQDRSLAAIAPALQRAYADWRRRIKDERTRRQTMDRLIPDPDGWGVARAEVIIEAIFEDLPAKRALLQNLEKRSSPNAILATNTSSLRLEDLQTALAHPERLIGIHFFNPVARMPLVEVVSTATSDPKALRCGMAFVRQIDKLPLPVRSAPGFLVNAVLGPYLLAAMQAVDQGVSPETVDEAMRAFGMPMGPIELIDMVGLDVALAAGAGLTGAPGEQTPTCLREKIAAGQLGKKTGRGFYMYREGRAVKNKPAPAPAGLAERLVRPLLERSRQLVAAGIVADDDLADAGVIFGTGFAPFTGGPLHYQRGRDASPT
ncbi:MAG TPA: 3-hydroxyacyl-CoA dehydrogenase NAD-binding domain-containing protein [Accumulibacter sp.]|nr:3-hydroxyacyl-CoA dehydrogenase NAD-binding domain-containing protein [Accumulibacter sp.]HND80905.1 3-hydroxyacyl-CoA dehydrogenase NAD-binding domain-containing protein [Accumulibacter sp.]HNE13620.1 3-hydroxyacyl-CoA dehydrogenase NAD-binding domain-containing protein [Accumulibacter sp.]HNG39055.1 3-hydroxyacyl-CoA dehydrogenase NAD-binding domain-containing protein [Accumulibacter sp.]HNL14295.1 3-hydroxyacyl-CoA dehydrogenase NAD-binding domain-containing protein [Accumulibacter sp.]